MDDPKMFPTTAKRNKANLRQICTGFPINYGNNNDSKFPLINTDEFVICVRIITDIMNQIDATNTINT